jgi:uncharacterized membrane protein
MKPQPATDGMPVRAAALLASLLFTVALALSWLIPPMQSPDETSHITRAYLISRGQWLLNPPEPDMQKLVARYADIAVVPGFVQRLFQHGGRTGGQVDLALLDYVDAYRAWPGAPLRKLTAQETQRLADMPWRGEQTYYVMPGTGYYFPLIYAPQALGLLAGRGLGWSVDHSYRLARGFTLLASALLLWLAFRRVRPSPVVLAVLLLPMSLFQMLSPTVDGLSTALAVLCISQFLSLMAQDGPPGWRQSIAWAAGLFVLATTRTHLLVLLALPLVVAWRHRSGRNAVLGGLAVLAALGWTLFAMSTSNDMLVPRGQGASELLRHYLAHPLDFARVLGATLTNSEQLSFYQRSFIGILGALDVPLPASFYPWLWTALGACALASVSRATSRAEWKARGVLALAALGACTMVFLALLLTWTPHPAQIILGVQGRYFVVPAILVGYVLGGRSAHIAPTRQRLNQVLVAGFGALSLTALITTLLSRYH